MLVIDDQLLNLARMQEAILKRTTNDRQDNLEKYKKTVVSIDTDAFACLLEELEKVNEHNRTLEDELQFLEQIRDSYNQLLELQLSFKRVCESCGENHLELSDLSQVNIKYVEDRINTINGYLINIKNIDSNKKRLEELNEQLFAEEKKKKYLSDKIKELEEKLRKAFIDAQGRVIESGKMVPTSVIDEYKKNGIDFVKLLDDKGELSRLLKTASEEKNDADEKLRVAKICYRNVQDVDGSQVLKEVRIENLNAEYRLILLRIIELLSYSSNGYAMFKNKIEQLQQLISDRLLCLSEMGLKMVFDPFRVGDLFKQMEMLATVSYESDTLNKIKKEIAQLSERVEDMINQNNTYMVELNHTEPLLINKVKRELPGIETSWEEDSYFMGQSVHPDNQVVKVQEIFTHFNLNRALQKTNLVLSRVNDMIKEPSLEEASSVVEESVPELEIIPEPVFIPNEEKENSKIIFPDIFDFSSTDLEDTQSVKEALAEEEKTEDIFETVEPFKEASMFLDRTDDDDKNEVEKEIFPAPVEEDADDILDVPLKVIETSSNDIAMPEAFWTVQEDDSPNLEDDSIKKVSDTQDDETLNKSGSKTRKLEKDNLKKAA